MFNPVDFNEALTITGNWAALPAANSPYPSTIPGQLNWQPTSANIITTLQVQFGWSGGPIVYNTPLNVAVTAPTVDGYVGVINLKWTGLALGLPILGNFVYVLLGDTGPGNTVP
jgi:hypothetical protein